MRLHQQELWNHKLSLQPFWPELQHENIKSDNKTNEKEVQTKRNREMLLLAPSWFLVWLLVDKTLAQLARISSPTTNPDPKKNKNTKKKKKKKKVNKQVSLESNTLACQNSSVGMKRKPLRQCATRKRKPQLTEFQLSSRIQDSHMLRSSADHTL